MTLAAAAWAEAAKTWPEHALIALVLVCIVALVALYAVFWKPAIKVEAPPPYKPKRKR